MRYHAIEADADDPGPFTVGRGWPQCGSLALMSNEMSKGASALEEPEVLPPACQIKFKSTHLALMAAQTDGTIVPRAHTATLETEYAPALRSLVTSEASNAACSARRRFRYSYWFEDTGGASIGYT